MQIGKSPTSAGEGDQLRTRPANIDKESFLAEIERKRDFNTMVKNLVHSTNFSVGNDETSFDRKEVATIGNPDYQRVTLSPKPHKNISTLKLKYNSEQEAFAKPQLHSKTMDINRVELNTLALSERPKILSHLKQSSIKFNGNNQKDSLTLSDRNFLRKMMPYMHQKQFRDNSYHMGLKNGIQT